MSGVLVEFSSLTTPTTPTPLHSGRFGFLAHLQVKGRRIAVLGDHLELGAQSESEHRKIGKMLLAPALSGAILIGGQMRHAWRSFPAAQDGGLLRLS